MTDHEIMLRMLSKANLIFEVLDNYALITIGTEHVIGTVRETGEKVELDMPIKEIQKSGKRVLVGLVTFSFNLEGDLELIEGETNEY